MPWVFVFILAECFKTLSLFTTPSLFLARPAVFRILVPWPGTEPMSPAMEGWSPNHWRAREVSTPSFLTSYYPSAWDLTLRWGGGCGGSVTSLQCLTWPCSLPLFLPSTPAVLCYFFFTLFSFLCPILLSFLPTFSLHPPLYPFLPLLSTLSFPLSFLISSPPSFPLLPSALSPSLLSPLVWAPVRCIWWCFLLCVGDP